MPVRAAASLYSFDIAKVPVGYPVKNLKLVIGQYDAGIAAPACPFD